jgi:anti-sigma regulatory factor (Ser/Thr protein kinase)
VDQTLAGWDGPEGRDAAVLLVDELVTNAIRHAGTPVDLVIEADDDALHVEVFDAHPGLPVSREPEPMHVSGRGLVMVAALAEAWGVRPEPEGKAVWFRLRSSRVGADE